MRELFFVDDATCGATLVAKLYAVRDYGVLLRTSQGLQLPMIPDGETKEKRITKYAIKKI